MRHKEIDPTLMYHQGIEQSPWSDAEKEGCHGEDSGRHGGLHGNVNQKRRPRPPW
jgi:hypothetical protein